MHGSAVALAAYGPHSERLDPVRTSELNKSSGEGSGEGRGQGPRTSAVLPCESIDLEATLDGGQAFRWWQEGDGYRGVVGRRAYRLSAADAGIHIETGDGGALGEADLAGLHRYLGLDYDLEGLRGRYGDDRCIGSALGGWPGLRVLRQDRWECLVAFICSSISNIPRIKLNVGSLSTTYGDRVGPGRRDFAFPAPERLAEAGEAALRRLGLGFRARYVARAAEAVVRGELDLEAVYRMPYEDALDALTALDGVGEKVADCVLAFAFDKPQAFPIDRWVKRALQEWYGAPATLSNGKTAAWARARFGNDGAYIQQYLFHRQRIMARLAVRTA
ncbi:MAG: hypothetical protein HY682_10115 [Chloroflexi bacterium]|nr:hypothetical protein [Chloroflexota bacterium]